MPGFIPFAPVRFKHDRDPFDNEAIRCSERLLFTGSGNVATLRKPSSDGEWREKLEHEVGQRLPEWFLDSPLLPLP